MTHPELNDDQIADVFADRGVEGPRPWRAPDKAHESFGPGVYYLGAGSPALEVCVLPASARPRRDAVRDGWRARQGRQAAPLLLIAPFLANGSLDAHVCGPTEGDLVMVAEITFDQAVGLAVAALKEPSGLAAVRYLRDHVTTSRRDFAGLRNQGMFATHTLRQRVRERADWLSSSAIGRSLRGKEGRELIEALGFEIERTNSPIRVLRTSGRRARGIAVFLDRGESYDSAGGRFGESSALSLAFTHADRENIAFVVLTRGSAVRLYAASRYEGVGRKGAAETYVQADMGLLSDDEAGYVPLIFSANALDDDGSFGEILRWSRDFSAGLSARLRERVFNDVVPLLAVAVAEDHANQLNAEDPDLEALYEETLVILFRLLFLAYAEDRDLLPYRSNASYERAALKTLARELATRANERKSHHGVKTTSLWTDVSQLFEAVDKGNDVWEVPAYNGGLFSPDPGVSKWGAAITRLKLTDERFAPPLTALLTERDEAGVVGPVDFRSLSVRDLGTIYEGLLESSLAIAPSDLALDRAGNYVPAADGQEINVPAGAIYHHDRSGARKSSGSYFTKDIAVEHLLSQALEPALEDHLARLSRLVADGRYDDAARAFFDFRCADLAMGSGHFLVAAVDRIERRLAQFLDEHPIPAVQAELDRLKQAALTQLGDSAYRYEIERRQLLRRQVGRRCVYGVDRNEVAVELARVSLWVHTFVPGLPLSFLDHNLVQGDSLTGVGTVLEAVEYLAEQASGKRAREGQVSVFEPVIIAWLDEAAEPLRRLARASDATRAELEEVRHAAQEARARVEPVRKLFNLITAMRRGEAAPFPSILTTDAVEEHPDLHRAEVAARRDAPLHFPVVFPEVFVRDTPGFDCIIGNPPWEELTVEKSKWWNLRLPGLRSRSEADRRRLLQAYEESYPHLQAEYEVERRRVEAARQLLSAGPYDIAGGDPDLYKYFAWRFWQLARSGGAIGVVLPQSLFAAKGSAPWRNAVLPAANSLVVFCRNEREWLFDGVNPGYTITLSTFLGVRSNGHGGDIAVIATVREPEGLANATASRGVHLNAEQLGASDPDLCLPRIETTEDFALFTALLSHPGLGRRDRSDFELFAATELHATNDRNFFRESGDPVFNHLNVGHLAFDCGAGAFACADIDEVAAALHARRQRSHGRHNSPMGRMPREWAGDPSTLPLLHPRLAIRDVVHATNPRKVWAALLPARTIVTNKAPYLIFTRGSLRHQAYVLGMLGSSVCDWFGHLRVVLNLNFFILNALPVPLMDEADPLTERVATLAAGLAVANGGGDYGRWHDIAASDIDDADDARAELDALASLLYGLDERDLDLIWNANQPTRPGIDAVLAHRTAWRPEPTG